MTWRGGGPFAALGLFTVLPVGRAAAPRPGVVRWFPATGAVVGLLACVPVPLVWRGPGHGSALLAAVLAETTVALLTRGLHLDGLADLADGLGSGRPPAAAREVMRRSDIGPFGVLTLLCVVLARVAALAALLGRDTPTALASLVTALVTGRVAVVAASGEPASPGSSFGALVTGGAGRTARVLWRAAAVVLTAGAQRACGGGAVAAVRAAAGAVAALAVAGVVRRHAVRRLEGVSGDVFGALTELATAVALVVSAGGPAWR